MKPGDRLIVLSDHGFESFRRAVHLNRWLVEQGFLALKPGAPSSESLFTNVDWPRSKAFALGLNGIFLNLKGREALGVVPEAEAQALKQEIASKLQAFRDPDTGAAVVATVRDRSEVYQGAKAADAPDLVIGYARGYRASWQTTLGGVPETLVEDNTRKWSGDHCIEPSFVPGVLFTSFKLPAEDRLDHRGARAGSNRARAHRQRRSGPDRTLDRRPRRRLAGARRARWRGVRLAPGRGPDRGLGHPHGARLDGALPADLEPAGGLPPPRPEIRAEQTRLTSYEGPLSGLWPLIGRNFLLAGRHLWLTLVPALIATIPVLLILAWASNAFDARWPQPGDRIEVRAVASEASELPALRWQGNAEVTPTGEGAWSVVWPEHGASLKLLDSDATVLLRLPTAGPASVVHQRRWWNALIGNPAGYLPSPGEVDAVELGLPQSECLPFGPRLAARPASPSSSAFVLIGSLLLKHLWRLH